jgi:hypothetical protein
MLLETNIRRGELSSVTRIKACYERTVPVREQPVNYIDTTLAGDLR